MDERDSVTVARDIASIFQQINIPAEINNVTDTVLNNGVAENINVTEVAVSSKLIPSEFIETCFITHNQVYLGKCSFEKKVEKNTVVGRSVLSMAIRSSWSIVLFKFLSFLIFCLLVLLLKEKY